MTLDEWLAIRPPNRDRVELIKWALELTLERHAEALERLKDL